MFKIFLLLLSASLAIAPNTVHSGPNIAAPTPTNLSIYLPIVAQGSKNTWIGPEGGTVVAVDYNPQNPHEVYAGTWGGGIYKSLDGGAVWFSTNTGLGNYYIESLAVAPGNPNIVYAGTYRSGVYKSIDWGFTWTAMNTGIQDGAIVYTIAVDPQDSQRVYIGTRGVSNNGGPPWNGAIYRTSDGGSSWTAELTAVGGSEQEDWVYSIEVHPASPNILYAAAHEYGPFRSLDYGDNWEPINNGVEDHSGRVIAIDATSGYPGNLYYGVWHRNGVYHSVDGGDEWTEFNRGLVGTKIYTLALAGANQRDLFATSFAIGGGIFRTAPDDPAWESRGLEGILVYSLAARADQPDTLLAGTSGEGILASDDGGLTWRASQSGVQTASITAVIPLPGTSETLLASNDREGVARTTNGGASWELENNGLSDLLVHGLAQKPGSTQVFAYTQDAGLFTCDILLACTWSSAGNGLPLTGVPMRAYPGGHPFGRVLDPDVVSLGSGRGDTQLSVLVNAPLLAMVFTPGNPNHAYIGSSGSGLFRSTDGGQNWQPAGLDGKIVWGLAAHPTKEDLVYAATSDLGGVWFSTNGGATWSLSSLTDVNVYSLATTPTQPDALYAGTSSGVWKSVEGSWLAIGLEGQVVSVIAAHPTEMDYIIAGTTNGAWVSTDGGMTWTPGPLELGGQTIQAISFSPSNPKLVYFGTKAHSILRAYLP